MPKYVFTIVTKEPLTEEEQLKLFETLGDTDKVTTSAIRKITDKEWDAMFEVLNNETN